MDRRARLKALVCAAGLCGLVAAAAPAPPTIREALWLAPDADVGAALIERPGACEAATLSPTAEVGRALFKSPGVLGGPAARLGLSCDACHANGRANAHFFLPELTDRAGHADVTSAWSSKARDDGVFNPRPIPDLAGAAQRTSFGSAGELDLSRFVRGVIVDEFQGATPSGAMIESMVAYLAALDPNACLATTAVTLEAAADDVQRAVAAMVAATDPQTRAALSFAARDRIGRIVERLPAAAFARARTRLEAMARDLTVIDTNAAPGWAARFDGEIAALKRRQRATYFDRAALARALNPPSERRLPATTRGGP